MKVLVVGGAGYIGSHMVKMLVRKGHDPVVLDNLSSGHAEAVLDAPLIIGDMGNAQLLDAIFREHQPQAVMHFAGSINVGESVANPGLYYANNTAKTLALLEAMVHHQILRLIFSSTAAIFGNPTYTPIDENHPKNPINPYGRSKWMVEQILEDYDRAHGLKSIALRYFNAAGADPDGELGERHDPETHLIPLALQLASGRRPHFTIYGTDFDTPDGTCIRDFVHVQDLCHAHLLGLERLARRPQSNRFNLGTGTGFSVREVLETVQNVTGEKLDIHEGTRRPGDPPILVADNTRARRNLGWTATRSSLHHVVGDAWNWERRIAAES
jgi:UDP-glucose 4-epimerase